MSMWTARRLRRVACFTVPPLTLLVVLAAGPVHYVYFDRSGLPDLDAFLRFEPPRIGKIFDERGTVLIELAREYRHVVTFDEVPPIVREAILAAEDKDFFSHSGVEYGAFPRVAQKATAHSMAAWWRGDGLRPSFPQGGSTLTQQLVRTYFLRDLTIRENSDALIGEGRSTRVLSAGLGVRPTNKLLRKMEEVRVTLWLEKEMERRFGSQERAKQEIFARYASFIYMGNGRYGFAAASEYYFDKALSSYTEDDAGLAALLAGISKSPRVYAPVPGDPRPLRRRNAILELMARNGSMALVQQASRDAGDTTSSSLAFAASNTAGNFIAVALRAGRSHQVFTVSDSRGNLYRQAARIDVTLDTPLGGARSPSSTPKTRRPARTSSPFPNRQARPCVSRSSSMRGSRSQVRCRARRQRRESVRRRQAGARRRQAATSCSAPS